MTAIRRIVICLAVVGLAACGGNGSDPDGGGGDDGAVIDADPNRPDAVTPIGCGTGTPGTTQCTDCVDNDNDGRIDGTDPECTGAADDDEGSFATGIPGDNMDDVKQDCFFDGNSGSGNDGCEIHVCCLLGAPDQASCPIGMNSYDPAECDDPQSQACYDACLGLVPPGCDCFGCCTICDPNTNMCYDVITNPNTAPNCNDQTLADPNACPRCTKIENCSVDCDPNMCVLCPGQDPSDLPPSCGGTNMCPEGSQECSTQACPAGQFCSNYCCIEQIE